MSTIPTTTGAPQASQVAVENATPMIGGGVREDAQTVISDVDAELAKLFEDRNVLLVDGGLITWTGTSASFTQSLKLHINSRSVGTTGTTEPPAIIDLGSATQTLNDGDMLYVVITRPPDGTNTGSATPAIATTAVGLPRVNSTNQEVFLLAKSSLSGDGVQRLYFRNGTALDPGSTVRLGASGSGSGSGNTILETLKNQLVDSPYQLVTPNIIATDTNTKFSTLTGATYDVVNKVIKFTADSQTITSTNMIDVNEFLPQALGIGSVDLSVFWNKGTSLQAFAIPPSFTYNVSRDGGNNYFPVTMNRVGTTEAFYGNLVFDTSTTTEATNSALNTISGGTLTTQELTASSSDQALAQSFTVPANTNWVIKTIALTFTKTGSPTGNVYVSLYTSSGGLPTTTVLAQSNAVTAASITTGSVTVTVPTTVLTGGTGGTTYQLVVTTDATYKSSFSTGVTSLALTQSNSTTGESQYNGTTWAAVASKALVSTVSGRTQDLRVQIVSAGSPTYPVGLDGYGIFYNLQNTGVVGQVKKNQRFVFNSVTDNLNSFTITSFNVDPDLISAYWVEGGQVFKAPAFSTQGNTIVFPTNTFNQAGVSQTITLIFDQNTGGATDGSDANARLMAANHLGSTDGSIDKSSSGKGVVLRNGAGTLVELAVDSNNGVNLVTDGTITTTDLHYKGAVAGTAIPSGYIGEYVENTITAAFGTSASNSYQDTGLSISLSPGVWLIGYTIAVQNQSTATTASGNSAIRNGGGTVIGNTVAFFAPAVNGANTFSVSGSTVQSINSTTTFKVSVRSSSATANTIYVCGNSNSGGLTAPDNTPHLWATRIA